MGIVQALLQEPVQRQLELALHTFNRGLWARLGEIPLLFARKDPKAQRREFNQRFPRAISEIESQTGSRKNQDHLPF